MEAGRRGKQRRRVGQEGADSLAGSKLYLAGQEGADSLANKYDIMILKGIILIWGVSLCVSLDHLSDVVQSDFLFNEFGSLSRGGWTPLCSGREGRNTTSGPRIHCI